MFDYLNNGLIMEETAKSFLDDKSPVIVGVSNNKAQWGNELFRTFINAGYNPKPVGNNVEEVEGVSCYSSIDEINEDSNNLLLAVSKSNAEEILDSLKPFQYKMVWFANGSKSKRGLELAEAKGMKVIYGYCPLMFLNGRGIHKFHYTIKRLFS